MSPARADRLAGAAGAAFGGAGQVIAGRGPAQVVAAMALGASLGLVRRHTVVAGVIGTAALLAIVLLPTEMLFVGYALVGALTFGAARWGTFWEGVGIVAGLTAVAELEVAMTHDSSVPPLLVFVTVWAAGSALRERDRIGANLAERARELDEEREAYAELSVRYERARIASELHDIVAHAISVMVVQATAGQRLAASEPDLTAETFEAIAEAARQAEGDMGRLVALLGDHEVAAATPDLALVEELVTRAAGSGLDVTLRLEGDRDGLAPEVAQGAYRVVQESLTNALRYASGAAVRVRIAAVAGNLEVEVVNAPADHDAALSGVGTGNGLRGLRERVGAVGGTVEAGPTADGGWRVAARLPRLQPAPR